MSMTVKQLKELLNSSNVRDEDEIVFTCQNNETVFDACRLTVKSQNITNGTGHVVSLEAY